MCLTCRLSIAILLLFVGCVEPFPDLENVSTAQELGSQPEQGGCSDNPSLGAECTYTCPGTSNGYPSMYVCVDGAIQCEPKGCPPPESGLCRPGDEVMCTAIQGSTTCDGRQICSDEGQWEACQAIQETCIDETQTTDDPPPMSSRPELCNGADDDLDGSIDEVPQNQRGSCQTNGTLPQCPTVDPVCADVSDGTTQFVCPPVTDHWCGSCRAIQETGGRHILCTQPQSKGFAKARCEDLGAELSKFERTIEPRALQNLLGASMGEKFWVAGRRGLGEGINYNRGSAPKGLTNFLTAGEMDGEALFNFSSGLLELANPNERHGYICELPCSTADPDLDGYTECEGDCAPNNADIAPYSGERTNDGVDNNCNGLTDELNVEICDDGLDNDGDGQQGESDNNGEVCVDHSVQPLNCSLLWINGIPLFDCASEWSWDFADGICDTHSARLANFNVHTWQQYWAYRLEVRNTGSSVWFGVRRSPGRSFTYRPDGSPISETDLEWSSFAPGEPQGSNEHCLELQCSDTECAGRWNNEQCWTRNHFVCEYTP